MDEAISGRAVEIRIQTRQANRQNSVRGKAAAEQLAAIAANEYGFYANGIRRRLMRMQAFRPLSVEAIARQVAMSVAFCFSISRDRPHEPDALRQRGAARCRA